MSKFKLIAFYLPQFHAIKENNEWWGEGFTEWVNVKAATPLFEGHNQPRIPLNANYYDLSDVEIMIWQAELAKKYGIHGFCYYHYWFDGQMLLEKPTERMLEEKKIDLPFCFCWANEDWTRAWSGKTNQVLIKQTYSDQADWERHFYYMLKFFNDARYIRIDGKPLFVIYRPEIIKPIDEMLTLWQKLAKENGLPGISFAFQQMNYNHVDEPSGGHFDFGIEYQPPYAMREDLIKYKWSFRRVIRVIKNRLKDITPDSKDKSRILSFEYDRLWQHILNRVPVDAKMIPGAFVDWDTTPRRQTRGSLCHGVTPEKFAKYLSQQIKRTKEVYNKDMLFIFAWNEWGESGYLEPDEKFKFGMLEGVKKALKENE
jgi:hypothetical protein